MVTREKNDEEKHHQTPKWCHNKMRSSILDFSSQSNNPSIKFWRISSVASWLFVPGFETQSSSANHFQVCRFTSMHFIKRWREERERKKICMHKNATRVLLPIFCCVWQHISSCITAIHSPNRDSAGIDQIQCE